MLLATLAVPSFAFQTAAKLNRHRNGLRQAEKNSAKYDFIHMELQERHFSPELAIQAPFEVPGNAKNVCQL